MLAELYVAEAAVRDRRRQAEAAATHSSDGRRPSWRRRSSRRRLVSAATVLAPRTHGRATAPPALDV